MKQLIIIYACALLNIAGAHTAQALTKEETAKPVFKAIMPMTKLSGVQENKQLF